MKKILSLILAVMMIFTSMIISSNAADETKKIKIDSSYSIVVKDSKSVFQNAAAKELQKYLNEAIGAQLPITNEKQENSIIICQTGIKSVYANGYRIFTEGKNVIIDGSETRGYIHGVYRFLEEFAGLRIYTNNLKSIDKGEFITVPADTSILYNPYFEYTDTDFVSPRDPNYSLCNGLTGGTYRSISTELGGTVGYIGPFCHTLTTWLCSADKYFESHPEYFALRNGKRTNKQLCLTNPDVVKIVTQEVLDALKANHNPSVSLQIVSLTQNDNQDYCECDNCKKFEKEHGDVRSATMINFVNQVADVVAQAGYDNVAIDTFAYQYTRQAPKNIVPRSNVIVRLCTIEGCFMHALDDPDCKENVEIMKDLEDWSKICGRIYIWDYVNNYRNTLSVWPNFDVIQRNIQIFYEHNVKGIYEEGNYYMSSCNGEFGDLKSYMISRCLQNPYCDLDKDIDLFLEAFYGDGWYNIKEFIKMTVAKGGKVNGHMSIYEDAEDILQFTNKDIKTADKLWYNALKLAKEDYQIENLKRSQLSYRYYKCCANKGEFGIFKTDRKEQREQLYNDVLAAGITTDCEGGSGRILNDPYVRLEKANDWGRTSPESFKGKILNIILKILDFFKKIFG